LGGGGIQISEKADKFSSGKDLKAHRKNIKYPLKKEN
jgi:hypothetical protein